MQTLMLFSFKLPPDSVSEIKTIPESVVDVTNLFVWEETEDDENAMLALPYSESNNEGSCPAAILAARKASEQSVFMDFILEEPCMQRVLRWLDSPPLFANEDRTENRVLDVIP